MSLVQTPEVKIGSQAPDFNLKDPGGDTFSRSDLLTKKGLVIAFVCNHCPYVVAVAKRMAEDFAQLRAEGFGVAAIMSNDYHSYPSDAPDRMVAFAAAHGWGFPYLVDEDQSVASAYGAVCTPDFFGYDGTGALRYRGRIDSAGMRDANGRTRELVDAMGHIAKTGVGPDNQMASMGCSIKWR